MAPLLGLMITAGRASFVFPLLLAACLGTGSAGPSASEPSPDAPAASPSPESAPEATPEATPEPTVTEPTFVDGPAIAPAADLSAWLGKRKGVLMRLPVVLDVEPFGVGNAVIAMSADATPGDALKIQVDQGAMSVALHDRILPLMDAEHGRVGVWLQGYWGPTVALTGGPPGFDGPAVPGFEPKPAFSVRKVVALVKDGDSPHVQVAAK